MTCRHCLDKSVPILIIFQPSVFGETQDYPTATFSRGMQVFLFPKLKG